MTFLVIKTKQNIFIIHLVNMLIKQVICVGYIGGVEPVWNCC
jgi:hypothetical protein